MEIFYTVYPSGLSNHGYNYIYNPSINMLNINFNDAIHYSKPNEVYASIYQANAIFEMLVEDLKQAFLCSDWSMKGLRSIIDETKPDLLYMKLKEILNMRVFDKLDDIDETTEFLQ